MEYAEKGQIMDYDFFTKKFKPNNDGRDEYYSEEEI